MTAIFPQIFTDQPLILKTTYEGAEDDHAIHCAGHLIGHIMMTQGSPRTEATPRPRQGLWRPTPVWRFWRNERLAEGVDASVGAVSQPALPSVLASRPPMQSQCLRISQYTRLFESISVLSFGVPAPYDHIEVDFVGGSNVLVDSSIGRHGSWWNRSNCPFVIS